MNSIFRDAAALCAAQTPFVWASIISQNGSTPRSAGSKMIITADSILATIGGGGMEGEVIQCARTQVLQDHKTRILYYDMSGTESATLGLVCGGTCEVLLAYGAPEFKEVFEAAADAELSGVPAWMCYVLDEQEGSDHPFQLLVNVDGKKLVGEFTENPNFSKEMLLSPIRVAVHGDHVDGMRYIADDVGSAPRMFLFGAGHVSCEVAKIAVNTGFHVIVIDDREEFANSQRFPDCEVVVIDSFEQMPDFPVDANSYVVIMTRGHAYDQDVLRWALGKAPFYLGMIGSKSKRDGLYQRLNKEGYPMEQLLAVKCPIGLTINAETPAEIAVSVMAEVISVRRPPKAK